MNKLILFAVVFGALFLGTHAVYDPELASFTKAPVQILTQSDTTNFQYPVVARYVNETLIALWGIYGDGQTPATYNAYLRLLNASTFQTVGDDISATLGVVLNSAPSMAYSTNGYLAIGGLVKTTAPVTSANATLGAGGVAANAGTTVTTTAIQASIFISTLDPTASRQLTIVQTSTDGDGFRIYKHWFMNDYFYFLYTETTDGVDTGLFIQGYSVTGNVKFQTPLQVSTSVLNGACNPQIDNLDDLVVVAWRLVSQNSVVYTTISLSAGTAGSETVLATDNAQAKYAAAAVVFSTDYYVILISTTNGGLSTGLTMSVAGSTTTTALTFALTNNYNTFAIADANCYFDGWFIIPHQIKQVANIVYGSEDSIQIFNYTATANNQTTPNQNTDFVLDNDGTVAQGFTLPDQSYYVFILDSTTGNEGTWKNGYIGQVFTQISTKTFGATMKVALATVFAVLASLFVF